MWQVFAALEFPYISFYQKCWQERRFSVCTGNNVLLPAFISSPHSTPPPKKKIPLLPKPKHGQSPGLDWGGESGGREEPKVRKLCKSKEMLFCIPFTLLPWWVLPKRTMKDWSQIFFSSSLKKSIFIANVDKMHLNLLILIIISWFS